MIDPHQLRIGNYVKDIWNDMSFEVVSICDKKLTYKGHQIFTSKYENVDPIPLSEQWLIDLSEGIDIEKVNDDIFHIDRFRLINQRAYKYWMVIIDDDTMSYITKVEWVHEWQNAFLALNGIELKLHENAIK